MASGLVTERARAAVWLYAIPRNLVAGSVTALVSIVFGLSSAAFVASGEYLQFLPLMIRIFLLGTVITGVVVAILSPSPLSIAGPAAQIAVIVDLMVRRIGQGIPREQFVEQLQPTIVAAVTISTALTGVGLLAIGGLRLGRVIRYIPYPVLGGFTAGIGWLIIVGSIRMLSGQLPSYSDLQSGVDARWLTLVLSGFGVAACFALISKRSGHYLVVPGTLVALVLGFHAVFASTGTSLDEARFGGWLFSFPTVSTEWGHWLDTSLSGVRWDLVSEQAGTMLAMVLLAMVFLTAMVVLVSATQFEVASRTDISLDGELRANGVANLASATAGGAAAYLSLPRSLVNLKAGATNRFSGSAAACLCGAFLFGGGELVTYLPKPVLAGLLIMLGCGMLFQWLWENRAQMSRLDYVLMLSILLIIAVRGFLWGLLIGLVAACLLFAYRAGRPGVIKYTLTGRQVQSRLRRGVDAERILLETGEQVHVLVLEGHVFFGTGAEILDAIRRRIGDPSMAPLQSLVLDFRHVIEIDASAVVSLARINQLGQRHGFVLVLAGAAPPLESVFQPALGIGSGRGSYRFFRDLDHALEWCEDGLIAASGFAGKENPSALEWLSAELGSEAKAVRLLSYFERVEQATGSYLFREGDEPDCMYLIDSGRVSVLLQRSEVGEVRLVSLGAGTMVGEMGLYRKAPRSASVFVETPSVFYKLTVQGMNDLNEDDPSLVRDLDHVVVLYLSNRMARNNERFDILLR